MANHALDLNPPNADIHISTHGSDWLWAAFSLITLGLLVTIFLDFTRPRGTRLFHQLAIIILATTSLAYFSMASDLGATPITTEFRGAGESRQIWYVRYIQWFITFPLLLLSVLLTTGLSLSDIVTTLFFADFVVISGLVGALVHSTYKWGYFTLGVSALFYVWYVLLWHAPRTTFAAEGAFHRGYRVCSAFLAFMLLTYPISWALSEGSNVISPTSEMIWYGILDVITGPIFLLFFLFQLNTVDYAAFGFASGKYTDTAAGAPARVTKAQEAGEQA
ncbi:heat shock protein 30 [Irpex rosettiformis]|uniref:Heat shock protein 30 n=1 Tax=Irpex rosettiformis TaxID=378272 RepID=A0ACB8UA30_9APHY|nr:heat shock protein 30 [Irpex rosettiformis]